MFSLILLFLTIASVISGIENRTHLLDLVGDDYYTFIHTGHGLNISFVVPYSFYANSHGNLIFKWYDKYDKEIKNSVNFYYENVPDVNGRFIKRLNLINVNENYSGNYSLKVFLTDNGGVVTHEIASKNIELIIRNPDYSEKVIAGDEVTVGFRVQGHFIPDKYNCGFKSCGEDFYDFNDSKIKCANSSNLKSHKFDHESVDLTADKIFKINFKPLDNGILECECYDAENHLNHKIDRIVKLYDDNITKNSDKLQISELNDGKYLPGDSIEMNCSISRHLFHDENSVKWSIKYGEILENSANISLEDKSTDFTIISSITIKNAQISNNSYVCTASSNLTTRHFQSSIKIEVRESEPPTVKGHSYPDPYTVREGENLKLNCTVNGYPTPKISWEKDGETIAGNLPILIIQNMTSNDEGEYRCVAFSERLKEKFEGLPINVQVIPQINLPNTIIIGSIFSIFFFLVLVVYLVRQRIRIRRLKRREFYDFASGETEKLNPKICISDQATFLPYNKKIFEFPMEKLKIGKLLGQGEFGLVSEAVAVEIMPNEKSRTVAVKSLKAHANAHSFEALKSELKILSNLGQHLNIVNLLGAVTKKIANHELYLILEFCSLGSLQSFLKVNRINFHDDLGFGITDQPEVDTQCVILSDYVQFNNPPKSEQINFDTFGNIESRPIKTSDLISWAFQCSRGMEFLTSRRVIHGDLAARNILLCEGNIIKISDFGLSKSVYRAYNYQYRSMSNGPIPFKWKAIECLEENLLTFESDVWSYGILLWELFSLAHAPYPGVENCSQLLDKLKFGYRMEKPKYANDEIYEIMRNCWDDDPGVRMKFEDLSERFGSFMSETLKNHYIGLNDPYNRLNDERSKFFYKIEQLFTDSATLSQSGYTQRNPELTSHGYIKRNQILDNGYVQRNSIFNGNSRKYYKNRTVQETLV